jgi:hypothetical protein
MHDDVDAACNGRDDEPGADVLARQYTKGNVQVETRADVSERALTA